MKLDSGPLQQGSWEVLIVPMMSRADTYHTQVPIYRGNTLVGTLLEQLGGDDLLDGQNDALLAPDADRCAAILDRLDRVLNLEITAVGREDGVGKVVARAYRRLERCEVS
jgi:hypothetical protein